MSIDVGLNFDTPARAKRLREFDASYSLVEEAVSNEPLWI
jgi:hypothetical protein